MSDEDKTAFVGRAPCGCARFACVEAESGSAEEKDNRKEMAKLVRKGWTIEKQTVGWVRGGGLNFDCNHRKPRK